MARLIYSMIVTLDGYVEDENGRFGWGVPDDEEVLAYINQLGSSVGTYLYGRRMYETMVFWETAHTIPDLPPVVLEWARLWKAADKIVFSKTLTAPSSAKTRMEWDFDPEQIRALKAAATDDISIDGPGLASQALKAGLVDELQMIVCPVVVGGGKKFFPDGVRLDLELFDERRFASGVVVLHYRVGKAS